MKSASGSGALPALCAQSASSSEPASRILRREPVERLDHAGFVIDLLDRDQRGPFGKNGIERGLVDQAVGIDRDDRRTRSPIACGTIGMFGRAIAPAR